MTDRVALVRQLIEHEGLKLKPYRCTAGKLTIGIGRNLEDKGVTRTESILLCQNDLDEIEAALDRHLPWWRGMEQTRQHAIADMAFNLGIGGLLQFKRMLSALEAKDYRIAADEALRSRWAKQVGQRAHRLADMLRHGT